MLPGDLEQRILERVKRIPVFDRIGVQVQEFSAGRCVATVPHDKSFDGIFDTFHGGMLMAAADTIACFALMTLTGPDERMATTDMNIRFLAPCLTDVCVDAKVIKAGKTICPVHVDLYDTNGKHVAVAQVSYIRLGKEEPTPATPISTASSA
jgi:uncharacterized protein (TIGR00369 family)